jgi:hypothetical protein
VKNLSNAPLDKLVVSCTGTDENGKPKSKTMAIASLGAGGTAKYSVSLDRVAVRRDIAVSVTVGGKPESVLNSYAQTQDEDLLALATKIFDQTKLVFVRVDTTVDNRTNASFRLVILRVDREFAQANDRDARAKTAATLVAAHFTKQAMPVGLRLMENDRQQVGWLWWADKLSKQ